VAEVTAATAAAAAAASERESSRLWLLVWAPPVRLERGSWSEGSTRFYSVQGDTWAGPGCLQYRYKVFLFPILFCITQSSGSNFLKKKSSGVDEEIGIWFHWQSYIVFPPFQIAVRLTFFTSSLTTRLIQIFVQNIIFFCCGLFYQYKVSKNDLNLAIFA
jgi:hypothetical protein